MYVHPIACTVLLRIAWELVHAAIWDDFQHELCVVQMLYITLKISVWLGILILCDV